MSSLHGNSSSSTSSSKRVGQVKANSKLNLISPRFKFLKKIGSGTKEKENSLTLSTSLTTRRSKHHSLDDLDEEMRRNVSFGRKGNKTRDAISDSEDDKASLWDESYGDTSTSHSDTDSDDWRDPTWVLDEWEEEERRLWREKKQREKEEQERREREAAGLPPLQPIIAEDHSADHSVTPFAGEGSSLVDTRSVSTHTSPTPTPTPTSPNNRDSQLYQRRNSRVEIVVEPKDSESDVRGSARDWPLRRARSFSETGEARVKNSKLDPGMKKRSISSQSLPSQQQGKVIKRKESREGLEDQQDVDDGDDVANSHGGGEEKSGSKRERKKKRNSIKRKSSSGILSTIAGGIAISKHSLTNDDGGSGEGGFLQSMKRRGRSLSKGKDKEKEKESLISNKERAEEDDPNGRTGTAQKLSRSDEKVRSQTAPSSELDELRSPRHSVCVTATSSSSSSHHHHHQPSHSHSHSHIQSQAAYGPVTATSPGGVHKTTPTKTLASNLALFPKRERASSAPYVPRLKLPTHSPTTPKSYFSPSSSSSASASPLSSPAASPLPQLSIGGDGFAAVPSSSLPSSPRSYLSTTPASSPSFLGHMPHRTPPLSPKGDKTSSSSSSKSLNRQTKGRSSSMSGASGSESEERLTWSNVWHSTTVQREMEIEAEVEMEMEIEERARSDELEPNFPSGSSTSASWQSLPIQQRTDGRERVNRDRDKDSQEREKTTPADGKKRSERHSGGASGGGIEMRSPEVLRWSGEMSRRSYRRSSLTGSQPYVHNGSGAGGGKDPREDMLAAREESLREGEEKVRQEREEFERERVEWEREREKLLLELKRLRILQDGMTGPPKDMNLTASLSGKSNEEGVLWSRQRGITTLSTSLLSPLTNNTEEEKEKEKKERRRGKEERRTKTKEREAEAASNGEEENDRQAKEGDEEGDGEDCEGCQEKEEIIRKLERDLKRVKYLYYEANGKLMEGTMRDKNRDKQHGGSPGGGGLHRSDSSESPASMSTTSGRPRQLKETASLIFHDPTPRSKQSPRGSPLSPRVGPKS